MRDSIDNMIKEMEKFKFSDEKREYYIFSFLKNIKDENEREEAQKYLKEKGIELSKTFTLASLFQEYNNYINQVTKFDKIQLADDNYKNILNKTKELANELKLISSLEISNLYTYLLWNGYFSKDYELKYQIFKRNMIHNHYSFDIMSGIGVCLNFSDMLTDIINLYDYNAASLINKCDTKQEKNYIPEIKRQITKLNIGNKILCKLSEPLSNKMGNHAFTLITEKDEMYIYDPTNFMIFNVDNRFKCTNICGTGGCDLKPVFSHLINHSKKSDLALEKFNLSNIYLSPYDRKDFIFTFENCIEMFNNNKNLLNSFHDEIHNSIEFISDNSKDIKRLIKENKKKL